MMPLWTIAMPSREMCGCALRSEGTPCVAQRVCAMPRWPSTGVVAQRILQHLHLADGAQAAQLPLPLSTATPAES